MTSTSDPRGSNHPRVIVAAVDDSRSASVVIREACEIANGVGASLHVLRVAESLGIAAVVMGGSPLALPGASELLRTARIELQNHADEAQRRTTCPVYAHLRIGAPWREIVQLATDLEADLLVIGTHDAKGFERFLLGSRAELIVRSAPCAVLVAREKAAHRADIPEILPPCPDCVRARRDSAGTTMWCAHHAEHHRRAHAYSDPPETFGAGSQQFKES